MSNCNGKILLGFARLTDREGHKTATQSTERWIQQWLRYTSLGCVVRTLVSSTVDYIADPIMSWDSC